MLIGTFIIIFDHPQIQYLDQLNQESYQLLDEETKNIYERLKIEYTIGISIIFMGIAAIIFSIFRQTNV